MTHQRAIGAIIGVFLFITCGGWAGQAAAQVRVDVGPVHVHVGESEPPPPDVVVVLTRGPVHEAFAEPVIFDQGPAFMISRPPPPPIDEIVPDERPAGTHILWVPGYWNWDTDRNDFIWISGCWRAVPPRGSWVPGYWAQGQGGYQWIAGFWTTADTDEIEYLPAPPPTMEMGPQGAGSPDTVWIPGCWVRQGGRYAWRAGFWEVARANWVWVPSQYVATPRGFVYVDGYWDYPLERRGMAFMPVYCPPSVYGREGFRYSPTIALDLDGLTLNLFIAPGRHHYYFGDYYGPVYAREGYHPWYEARDRHNYYDPIFVHQRWQHRDDHQWVEHQRKGYDRRRDDKDLRPARTYDAMRAQEARLPEKDRKQVRMARPMKEVVEEKGRPVKYEAVDTKTRERTAKQAKDVRAYQHERSQWEAPAAAAKAGQERKEGPTKETVTPRETPRTPAKESPREPEKKEPAADAGARTADRAVVAKEQPAAEDVQPRKVKIPKSPVAVREPVADKDQTPPARPEHPKADSSIQPRGSKADAADRSNDDDNKDKDKDKPESKKK